MTSAILTNIESYPKGDYPTDLLAIMSQNACPQGRKVLGDLGYYKFTQIDMWIGFVGTVPVTVNISHIGSRKKNGWEPYLNWYVAYTTPEYRRLGAATTLGAFVRELAVEKGCVRVKSLAGSWLGLLLHHSFGDQFWGLTPKREVQVDSPLVDSSRFPADAVPPNGRKWTTSTVPMTLEALTALTDSKLRYDL